MEFLIWIGPDVHTPLYPSR